MFFRLRNVFNTLVVLTTIMQSSRLFAVDFTVTNNSASGAGSLSQAITDLNASGTAGSAVSLNTITINSGLSTITLTADLPVIQKGVTINTSSGTQVIDGASAFRLFATYKASLSLNSLTMQNGLAQGGNGGTSSSAKTSSGGGGGGLGAGGAVYVDFGQSLTIANTTISACKAQGGNGGSISVDGTYIGSGGGASWSIASKQPTSTQSGGDYPGVFQFGGGIAYTNPLIGYGGGNGGEASTGTTAGTGGGDSGGLNATSTNAGNGGYCGGGGGGLNNSGGGGGGGNGGGNTFNGTGGGGSGGGYGSGGARPYGSSGSSAYGGGGGGGFGGGGGGGISGSEIIGPVGGGGGGFGGGGGGGSYGTGGRAFRGRAGSYAGNGGNGTSSLSNGAGGGGAGIGGAIFVGDSATLNLGDAVSVSSNTVAGGTGGTNIAGVSTTGPSAAMPGSSLAPDIFLFRLASLQFTGSSDLTVSFAIQCDTAAPTGHLDRGVTINKSGGTGTIFLTSTSNTYRGGTSINAGTLSILADSNLGSVPSSVSANSIQFGGGTLATTASFTLNSNRGITLNSSGGTISPSSGTTLSYSGIISGTNSLTKLNTGTLVLSGTNTYTGATVINAGTLQAGVANVIATSSAVTLADTTGAIFDLNNFSQSINNLSGGGATGGNITLGSATLTVNQTSALTYSGVISGSGGFTKVGASTLELSGTNTYTGITTLNAGTLSVANDNNLGNSSAGLTFGGGALATTSTLSSARNILLSAGGGEVKPAISTILTLSGNITGDNALTMSGAGTLLLSGSGNTYSGGTNIDSGTLQADGAKLPSSGSLTISNGTFNLTGGTLSSSSVTNNSGGTFEITGNSAYNAAINNAGAMTLAANLSGNGTINNTGTLTVSGNRTIEATSFVSPGTQKYTIVNGSSFDSLTSTGPVDISNGTVDISASTTEPYASFSSWNILTGNTLVTNSNTIINLPLCNCFGVWSKKISATAVEILYNNQNAFIPTAGVNAQLATIFNTMFNNIANSGQQQLINAVSLATTQEQYDSLLDSMRPNTSIASIVVMQNISANKAEIRLASIHPQSMYAAGDPNLGNEVWGAAFGSRVSQKTYGDFQGYNANMTGLIFGADTTNTEKNIYGVALGISRVNGRSLINLGMGSRGICYSLIFYGENKLDYNKYYAEWVFAASWNRNHGYNLYSIQSEQLNNYARFTTCVSSLKSNIVKDYDLSNSFGISSVGIFQYQLIYQPPYQETGSCSALNVVPKKYQSILTLGAGTRLNFFPNVTWLTGTRQLRASVTYDVLSSQQNTLANFVVGSNSFYLIGTTGRLALLLSANCDFYLKDNLNLYLSYNYELRRGFYQDSLQLKLSYFL